MSHVVESATPLEDVAVDGGQVWLRRDVKSEERTREFDTGEGETPTYTVYSAEEVTFNDPTVTAEYAREHFDELWSAHERDGVSLTEQVAAARQLAEDNAAALLELGDIIGGE